MASRIAVFLPHRRQSAYNPSSRYLLHKSDLIKVVARYTADSESPVTTLPSRILRNQVHGTNLMERSLITEFASSRFALSVARDHRIPRGNRASDQTYFPLRIFPFRSIIHSRPLRSSPFFFPLPSSLSKKYISWLKPETGRLIAGIIYFARDLRLPTNLNALHSSSIGIDFWVARRDGSSI